MTDPINFPGANVNGRTTATTSAREALLRAVAELDAEGYDKVHIILAKYDAEHENTAWTRYTAGVNLIEQGGLLMLAMDAFFKGVGR